MTVFKQKALLKKHNWTRTHIGNKEQLPTTTQFRPQDPEVGTSTTTTLQVSNSNGEHTPESSNGKLKQITLSPCWTDELFKNIQGLIFLCSMLAQLPISSLPRDSQQL